jgi:hypothetical protein
MIEQGDYMVVNLASRVRDLSRIQQSTKLQPRFGLWGSNFSQSTSLGMNFHDSWILREVLNIRILYLNEKD